LGAKKYIRAVACDRFYYSYKHLHLVPSIGRSLVRTAFGLPMVLFMRVFPVDIFSLQNQILQEFKGQPF